MAEKVSSPSAQTACREAVCVHTKKIFDSCRDKDCVEDLLVYPLGSSQTLIDSALSVRPRFAELLDVSIKVDAVSFNRGFYTVDAKFFYLVRGEAFPIGGEISGVAVFDKRVILFGSESGAKIFSSAQSGLLPSSRADGKLPTAVVEAVDPVALHMKILPTPAPTEQTGIDFPPSLLAALGGLTPQLPGEKSLFVTLGQFSILRLERDTQLLMPAYDYCVPEKECAGGDEGDPYTLFSRIDFPLDEFFPPDAVSTPEDYRSVKQELG